MPSQRGPRPDQMQQPFGTVQGEVLTAGPAFPSFELSTGGNGTGIPTGPISYHIQLATKIDDVNLPNEIDFGEFVVNSHPAGERRGQKLEFFIPDDYDNGDIELLVVYKMSADDPGEIIQLEVEIQIADINGALVSTTGAISVEFDPGGSTGTGPGLDTLIARDVLFSISNGTFKRGDGIVINLVRDATLTGDGHKGDWQTISFSYRYTGQVASRVVSQFNCSFHDTDEPAPTDGILGEFNTIDFPSSIDTEQKVFFVVPDNWDGTSDAQFRVNYSMSSAESDNAVLLDSSGEIAHVINGYIETIASDLQIIYPDDDTQPHRSVVIRSIRPSQLCVGAVIAFKVARRDAGSEEHNGDIKIINITMNIGSSGTLTGGYEANVESSKAHGWFTASQGIATLANPATFNTRNNHGILNFDDSVNKSILFEGVMNPNYDDGTLTIKIYWTAIAIIGDVVWEVAWERMNSNSLNIDSDSFAAARSETTTTHLVSGIINVTLITFTKIDMDLIAAGDPSRIKVTRETALSAGNTLIGNAEFLCLTYES